MTKTFTELLTQARSEVREVSTGEAAALADSGALLLDVRESDEWSEGHLPGAIHVPRGFLESRIQAAIPSPDLPIVVYCAGGTRSLLAAQQMQAMGYSNVVNMLGGIQQWKSEGRAWKKPVSLSTEQRQRYSRHLLIPEVGVDGQAKLLGSKALVVGAGGLGSPALLYLAAAGVGTLGIVDFDVVDLSNLQRQIVHTTDRVGERKVASAAQAVKGLNPEITVVAHEEMLGPDNVDRIIAGYDVILDGTDTFETRYTLNDAAVRAGIPVVHASVFRFEGQLTAFVPGEGPCYRCLYPTPPPPELAPGCSVAGVLGVVPGTLGILQATEALKLLLGIGEPLVGRLVIYDALDGTFQELKLRRDPACPTCGTGATADGVSLPIGPAAMAAEVPFALPSAPLDLEVRA